MQDHNKGWLRETGEETLPCLSRPLDFGKEGALIV